MLRKDATSSFVPERQKNGGGTKKNKQDKQPDKREKRKKLASDRME